MREQILKLLIEVKEGNISPETAIDVIMELISEQN